MEVIPMTKDKLEELKAEHERLCPDLPIKRETLEALALYQDRGIMPGGFLTAVLENNLMRAFGAADSYNRASLFQICFYIYNSMPSDCHGSRDKVTAWIDGFHES